MASFARVSTAPGRSGVSEWSGHAGKAEPGLPRSRVSQEGVSHHPSPSRSGQTPVERDRGRLIWLPQEQPSLSASWCGPGPPLQPPRCPAPEGCALAIVPGHARARDDKDLLWEALISSPSYALGLALGAGPWGSWPGDS